MMGYRCASVCVAFILTLLSSFTATAKSIKVFAGAAGTPPIREVARLYERKYGVTVECAFGGSGTMLSQMLLAKQGDVYIPGSDDFMDLAERKGVVAKGKRKIVAYLVPVIAVRKGNPKGIRTLQDLTRPGIRVGIARPKAVCLGDIAVEIFRKAGLYDRIMRNVVTHAGSCSQTAAILKLNQVDVVIGWDVFAKWYPKDIEVISLPPHLTRWRYIPAAVTKFARDPKEAQRFVDFITSSIGKAIFKKHGYTIKPPKPLQRKSKMK